MEGSNVFTIKVIFPDGFRPTCGTYTDYVGDQLTRDWPIREYTIHDIFERMPPVPTFRSYESYEDPMFFGLNGVPDDRTGWVDHDMYAGWLLTDVHVSGEVLHE